MTIRVTYVINSLVSAGAEKGLLTLVKEGFFKNFDLHIVALVMGDGAIYDELTAILGHEKMTVIAPDKNISDFKLPFFCFRLAQCFRSLKPDIIILSLPQAIVCGRIAAIVSPRSKLVIFEHTVERERRIANMLLKMTSSQTNIIFGDAARTLKACRNIYTRSYPEVEVPLVMLQPAVPRAWIKPAKIRLLSFGRLVPQKNYAALLHAIAPLIKSGSPLDLCIAGAGPLYRELENLAHDLGIADHVRFLGFVHNTSELLAQSHIYIQPSLREGLAISVLEAMAAGLIVVASDTGGICDYGIDHVNMFKIAPPAKVENIRTILQEALDSYANLAAMSHAAQRMIEQRFSELPVRKKWGIARATLRSLVESQNV